MNGYLTCPYCGKSGYKNLPSHTRQKHGKDLKALLEDFPNIEYEHPEYIKNKIDSIKKSCNTKEHRILMSKLVKQQYIDNPERRITDSDRMRKQIESGNIILGSGYKALKLHFDEDPEFERKLRNNHSKYMKNKWKNDRENIIFNIQSGWTEIARKRQSDRTKKNWSIPEIAYKMISSRKNDKLFYSVKLDMYFRSTWEVLLAETFNEKSIKFEYETHWFLYNKTHHYIPDFYLPDYDLFIEVKPTRLINQVVIDKLNAVIQKNRKIIFCTEYELFGENNIEDFTNKIVELKLCELLETREDYVATAQSVMANANA